MQGTNKKKLLVQVTSKKYKNVMFLLIRPLFSLSEEIRHELVKKCC